MAKFGSGVIRIVLLNQAYSVKHQRDILLFDASASLLFGIGDANTALLGLLTFEFQIPDHFSLQENRLRLRLIQRKVCRRFASPLQPCHFGCEKA